MAGLTSINDRINKVKERIDEIEEAQKALKEDSALSDINIEEMNAKRNYRKDTADNEKPDLNKLFGSFGI